MHLKFTVYQILDICMYFLKYIEILCRLHFALLNSFKDGKNAFFKWIVDAECQSLKQFSYMITHYNNIKRYRN